jgi:hypothetical protein
MNNEQPIPRSQLPRRRIRRILLTLVLCGFFAFVFWEMNRKLLHSTYVSGYILFAAIVFLTAFNLRKKLTFLPSIGSAATWMQLHIYVGLSTFLFFGFHIGWRVPNGYLEGFLAILYLTVALSGVYGLFITRVIPKRLTAIGDEFIFERIPTLRMQLALEARQTAMGALDGSEVIPRFYMNHLLSFFEKPRSLFYKLFPTGRKKRQLVGDLKGLERYLSDDQRPIGQSLVTMVQRKDDLDYHFAMQGRLKLWLFLHIGFTYSLLAISILHGILVHAFAGSGV